MHNETRKLPLAQVLLCGGAIVTLSMGIRHGFGLWLQPITQEMDWTRQTFALAIAVQNLAWGLFGIFGGMVADKFGAFRVLIGGAVLYALGLAGMALSPSPLLFTLTTGVLLGAAQAGTTYAIIYGVLGRQVPADKRSWAMGVAAAAGSFGQFLMMPLEGQLILHLGWKTALLALSAMVLLIVPLAWGLREPGFHGSAPVKRTQTVRQAFAEALRYRSFLLLTAGYFVCGFQVVFIGVHMPSYLRDHGLSVQVASYALALIGLFNVFGTYAAGTLGQRMPKRHILAFIYFARAVVITIFLLVPLSPLSVYVFSAVMGALWLSTVPPTNATVAQIFGVQHLYDRTGSYDIVWYLAIALGIFAGLVNLPVRESAIPRAAPQAA
jgi:predicted MFS family arabinose efflux permease